MSKKTTKQQRVYEVEFNAGPEIIDAIDAAKACLTSLRKYKKMIDSGKPVSLKQLDFLLFCIRDEALSVVRNLDITYTIVDDLVTVTQEEEDK